MAWGLLVISMGQGAYLALRSNRGGCTNMQAMAATLIDVAREFRGHLQGLPPILAAAFIESRPRTGVLSLVTLVEHDNAEAERQLAHLEMRLESAFQEFSMEFSTIHLRGRSPDEFIPKDALVILDTRQPARPSAGVK
jgi:hypothetical protein